MAWRSCCTGADSDSYVSPQHRPCEACHAACKTRETVSDMYHHIKQHMHHANTDLICVTACVVTAEGAQADNDAVLAARHEPSRFDTEYT